MSEKILQMLQDLANAVGTTVDKLWSALVAQAQVAAILNGIFILSVVLSLVAVLILYHSAARVARKHKVHVSRWNGEDYERTMRPFEVMFDSSHDTSRVGAHRYGLAVAFVILLVYTLGGVVGIMADAGPKMLTALMNPQFWALQKLGSILGLGVR